MAAGMLAAQNGRQADIAKAMHAVREAIPKAAADPARPVYHFHPPAQWNNDPNGTIFYRGWHHLFYQHNPYEAKWGHMHWGHARSRDLVNWEHLPIALWPSLEKGEEHIFSGGAVLAADGKPRLIYTSIGKQRPPEQWLAIPKDDDLIEWEKYPGNPVLTLVSHGSLKVADWRDPFMFVEAGTTYMVCGGNLNGRATGGASAVQLYAATTGDLTAWKHRGTVFTYRNRDVINIECPNLFRMGSQWVLLISPHRPCEYFVGSLDLERCRFQPETYGVLDPGNDYATNISRDDRGRTILWYWGRTETDPAKGWNCCMAIPRILSLDGAGLLRQQPAEELNSLRGEPRKFDGVALNGEPVPLGQGDCAEIEAVFRAGGAGAVGLRVRGKTEIVWDPKGGVLQAGSVKKMLGIAQPLRLRVFLDKRVLEVYANDGEAAIFTTVDPDADMAIQAFARGGAARLESARVWPLRAARMTLDRDTG